MFDVIPTNGKTWLICGGRDFADEEMFHSALDDIIRIKGVPNRLVHGGARGADSMSEKWGCRYAINTIAEHADWKKNGKAAGIIRNQTMLDKFKPALVVAFPGRRGTADMIRRAERAGIQVARVKGKEPS